MMDRYNAVAVLDEAQIYNSEDKEETIAILRGAYQKGNQRIKSVPTGHGWTDKAFNAFGFCPIASHDPLEEGIMQRCLSFSMVKRTRRLKKWRKPEFLVQGTRLRAWNLYYRLLHLGDPIPEEVEDQLEEIHDDRLQELALPLLTVAPAGPRQTILSFFKTLEKRKQLEVESGDESDYFRALDFFTTDKGKQFFKPPGRILFSTFKDQLLAIKKEAEPDYDPKWLSPRAMWKVLERLGFHHGGHMKEGSSIAFDIAQVEALRPQFNPQVQVQQEVSFPPSTVTTVTTVTPIENKVTEMTEVTDTGGKCIASTTQTPCDTSENLPDSPRGVLGTASDTPIGRSDSPGDTPRAEAATVPRMDRPLESGDCSICRQKGPVRPDAGGVWLVCEACYATRSPTEDG